jgi:cytoskeleton protein RodZ
VDSLDGSTTVTESPDPPPVIPQDLDALPPLPEADSDLGLVDDPDLTPAEVDTTATGILATREQAEDAEQATEVVADEPETAAAEPEPAPDPGVIELTFNEQSWTEIFDATNERVFVGLQEPGTTARVEGEPPFRLTVGNATGVEMRWRGESMNLGPRAGANNVARFTLGE